MKSYGLNVKAMKLEGVPQLIATMKDLAKTMDGQGAEAMKAKLNDAFMKPASVIRDEAKDLVPVVTGNLRDHLFAGPLSDKVGALVGVKGVPYAAFVEYGTARNIAHPYFRPAINSTRPLAANMMAGDFKDVIEEVCRNDAWHATAGSA